MFDLNVVLLTHLICTVWADWFVQVVHYPLMSMVGEANYQTFQRAHMRQTTWVSPPMLLEALTAVVLVTTPEFVCHRRIGVVGGYLAQHGLFAGTTTSGSVEPF